MAILFFDTAGVVHLEFLPGDKPSTQGTGLVWSNVSMSQSGAKGRSCGVVDLMETLTETLFFPWIMRLCMSQFLPLHSMVKTTLISLLIVLIVLTWHPAIFGRFLFEKTIAQSQIPKCGGPAG